MRWSCCHLLLLTACVDLPVDPPLPPTGTVYRAWAIDELFASDTTRERVAGTQAGGVVDVLEAIGDMAIFPAGQGPQAAAHVYSDRPGATYWVAAQAPTGLTELEDSSVIGSASELRQVWRFRKDTADASLQIVITQVTLEAMDYNSAAPDHEECPWYTTGGPILEFVTECASVITGEVEATYFAYADPTRASPPEAFYYASSTAKLFGYSTHWTPDVYTSAMSVAPLFTIDHFSLNPSVDGTGRHALARLSAPVTVEVPLDSVADGTEFELVARLRARANSRRQGESYVSAYFRDPVSSDGLSVDYEGLTLLDPPDEIPEATWSPSPVPACAGGSAGGTIQFASSSYGIAEWTGGAAPIHVTRVGGSEGEVSVEFHVSDGTASAGSDYVAVTTTVRYADGETGVRTVALPIVADTVAEPDETVLLSLSSPGGCAGLGLAAAQLTIMDDDRPFVETGYTLGGTVTGLEGSGLELSNFGRRLAIAGDGPFTFAGTYATGANYDVVVTQQPGAPAQTCTVSNGQGTIGEADVTDVLVTCETIAPGTGADPDFGTDGKVTIDIEPDSDDRFAMKLALQNGQILAVGRTTMARYNADGTADTGFGTGGEVEVTFYGRGWDRVRDVAVQPDGRILVAGYGMDGANGPLGDDFAVARYEANGTLDTSFGNGGVVVADFEGWGDAVSDIVIQPDGAIVLAGMARTVDQFGATDADFALMRLTSAGVPDATFGPAGNGQVTVDVGGRADNGHAAALQADGSIVIVGRAAPSGGSDPDIGIARFDADGNLDATFGSGGVVRDATAEADEAMDVVIDADGTILVGGSRVSAGVAYSLVARYDAAGATVAAFGSGGRTTGTLIDRANGIALDDTGRIVIVGPAGADFGVARLDASGATDTSFDQDGLVTADYSGGFDHASDVVIQPDGRILAGGVAPNGLNRMIGLLRVLP